MWDVRRTRGVSGGDDSRVHPQDEDVCGPRVVECPVVLIRV